MKAKYYIAFLSVILFLSVIFPEEISAQPILTPDQILFDAEYYELQNPELVNEYGSGFDAMYRHYLEHGRKEGRLPYAGADTTVLFFDTSSMDFDNSLEEVSINPNGKNIYVGDSRTYIMHQAIGDDGNSWIGFPGTRYDVFSSKAANAVDSINLSGKNIIILYGINDIMGSGADVTFNEYNLFMSTKAQEWIKKGAKVYFVNLCGVNIDLQNAIESATPNTIARINSDVAKFNKRMKKFPGNIRRVSINYGKNPFYDGIHYNSETCKSVYNQINARLK